jgi:hypothetical protein
VLGLDERLPMGPASLERAAFIGLTDSMPRAALLSIHARVADTGPSAWEDASLVQLWGPRFSAYVVAARDRAIFTLGRLPDEAEGLQRAEETAARLHAHLAGQRMTYGEAGRGIGVNPNMLRYAAPTGTVLMRWDGARQPTVWSVPPPDMDTIAARVELARRYVSGFGPATAAGFSDWAGIRAPRARRIFEALMPSLTAVETPIGTGWILTSDEASFRSDPVPSAAVRLLPSGDNYFLLHGADRALLVPEAERRPVLWTSRVWPGALLVGGEIVGTWRRADATVSIDPWRRLEPAERDALQAEAEALPLGLGRAIVVRWSA